MGRKIIRKKGKAHIEITVDFEDSMLDSEETIQVVVNEEVSLLLKKH